MITLNTSDDPIASILIPSQDNLDMLGDCLASVARSVDGATMPYEVIVLFQQTSRPSVQSFLEGVQGVRDLHARLNLGFGGGNNFAARYAKGKYLVFLNDDTIAQSGWLHWLVRAAEADGRIGAVGSRIISPDGTLQEAGAILWSEGSCYPVGRGDSFGSLSYSYVRDVDYASANGLLVRRSTFDSAGGFDDRFFPGYYEDVDLCLTIRHELDQRIVYEPRSVILHRESVTSGRDPDFRSFLFRRHQAALRAKWTRLLLSYPAPQPESRVAVERAMLRASNNPKRVLVVDDRVPSVGMGSGAGRIADLLGDLSATGFAVTMAPTERRHAPIENALGGSGVDLITEPLSEHLEPSEKRYDAVIISRPHNYNAYYAAIRQAMPQAVVIYDVEALYHRRLLTQARLERDAARRDHLQAEADSMQRLETEIAGSVDRLVAISDSEVAWLESLERHAPVNFMRPLARAIGMAPPDLQTRSGAVFVAGWLAGENSPNVGALQWYAEEVLPRVRAVLPEFVTFVSGGRPPLRVQSMEGDGLILLGLIQSVESLYRSVRVAIAPIRVGAGVKIKTIEALQYGVPVVATTIGAEGLGLADGEEIDVADDPEDYASRLIALATDDDLWLLRREKFSARIARWESEQIGWSQVVERAVRDRESVQAAAPC